ncbi:hypothetical protein [Mangrovibacterium diazotrophicum]|uniref:Uncharacterized protein n=1 Tax=Mangrovibacterium diazotrophicum TaxID=1261403 RepID=A0A419W9Z0_9BACT|nr:hypothetical protein [Mangrovibacterium diazotrophicum]RKD92222.1 hypothetical protein BC643_2592 [Mangrovibacterium diazotrophicum]
MKHRILHIFFLFLFANSLKAQNNRDSLTTKFIDTHIEILNLERSDSTTSSEIFRLWFDDYQVVELVSDGETGVKGKLICYVKKIARKEKKSKIISQCLTIPDDTAQRLFETFKENHFETLPDCRDIEDYVFGCDGSSVTFEIKTPEIRRNYYYWEPEFQISVVSTNVSLQAVTRILVELNKDINRSQLFKNFTNTLAVGRYRYGMIVLQIL